MENLGELFRKLNREDLSVLSSVDTGMRYHEWVPLPDIVQSSGLPARKVDYRLHLLSDLKLVERETAPYEGYQIYFTAYDLLALSDMVARNAVTCLGGRIGVGKESVVYEALGAGDAQLAIKFHRQGRTSFKHVRRVREHLKDLPRSSWLHAASLAARHEFRIMTRLYPQVSIPRPVAYSRHALAMELVCGCQLNRANLAEPRECLDMILEEVRKAYRMGIIHADFSEFNVMATESGFKIIDWPQAVETTHPNAQELIERDVNNILRFFSRRYRVDLPLEEAMAFIGAPVNVPQDTGTPREVA